MRKWVFHGLIYLTLAGLAAAAAAYALGTNPTAVRGMVHQQLTARFQHVSVSVERARLRLLGGILVRELRLARNDGLDRRDFLYVPNAVVYHDKEHLLDGQVAIRKVELTRPQIRIVRERDGSLNVAGILGPIDLGQPLPSVVIRKGTIVFEDRSCGDAPLLEVRDVQLSLVNDPLPTLQLEGSGQVDVLGPVRFRGTIARANFALDLRVDLANVPVGPDLLNRAALLCPDLAAHACCLSGRAELSALVRTDPGGARPFSYDLGAKFHGGRLTHKMLPAPLERIEVEARCVDGVVPSATLRAFSDGTRLDVRVADAEVPGPGKPKPDLDELGREMDVTITNLSVTPALLDRLPENIRFIKEDFSPGGLADVRYRFRRPTGSTPFVREWLVEPKGMTGAYERFPYPVEDVRGRILIDTTRAPLRNITLELDGKGGGSPASLRGTIRGARRTGEVRLDITGRDVLLDDRIDSALKTALSRNPKAYGVVRQFLPEDSRKLGLGARPVGRGDFAITVLRRDGSERMENRYVITFKGCRALYDQFPYPLEDVSGVLDLMPDGWECRRFRGSHKGGVFEVEACSGPARRAGGPGKGDRVQVNVKGKGVLLDEEFERALVPLGGEDRKGLQKAWRTLRLGGRLDFEAEVIDNPGEPQDIDVTVGVTGCTLRPTFFDYAMTDVSGTVRYAKNRVHVKGLKARHGPAVLGMDSGLIVLGVDGAYTAWLEGITGGGVPADRDLVLALPEGMRKGIESLALRDPFDLSMKLTVASPPTGQGPLKLWWETGVAVKDATFRAGIEVSKADGGFFCRGHHDGRQVRGVTGDLALERATVLNQPIEQVQGRLEVRGDSPEVFRFRDLKASCFGGTIGGEARLDTAPVLRYDVYLEAANVQLDQFGRHNLGAAAKSAQLSGPARAAVHLLGEGADLSGLRGNGRVDVAQGKMGQLPVLLDLVKAFGLRIPDRTAFEQAHLMFGLEGPRVLVQQLDLYGNAISLRGQGTADMDGSNLNLEFTASPGRLREVLPAGLEVIPEALAPLLYKIRMKGKLGQGGGLKFEQVPVPAVVEPIKRAMRGN